MSAHPLDVVAPLFVPANRPDLFGKAAATAADAVILDLEDAIAPNAKAAARAALRSDFTDKPVLVRVNGIGTAWHDSDMAAVAALPLAGLIIPKAERCDDLERLATHHPMIALVETAAGLANARALAKAGAVRRLAFGSVDYAADLRCGHTRDALAAARAELLLASRLAQLPPPIDGVTLGFEEPDAVEDDARHARELGFGGKLCIHPKQAAPVRRGFAPSDKEIAWARRVLAEGDGVTAVAGMMIDEPVRAQARTILKAVDEAFL